MTSRLKNDDEQKIHVIKMMTGRLKNYDEQGLFARVHVIKMMTSLLTIPIGQSRAEQTGGRLCSYGVQPHTPTPSKNRNIRNSEIAWKAWGACESQGIIATGPSTGMKFPHGQNQGERHLTSPPPSLARA
jgi:hypothetical protein